MNHIYSLMTYQYHISRICFHWKKNYKCLSILSLSLSRVQLIFPYYKAIAAQPAPKYESISLVFFHFPSFPEEKARLLSVSSRADGMAQISRGADVYSATAAAVVHKNKGEQQQLGTGESSRCPQIRVSKSLKRSDQLVLVAHVAYI